MANKDPIKISSIVITFIIFLVGSMLSFWIYTVIIQQPEIENINTKNSIEINNQKLTDIQTPGQPTVSSPADGYGRPNPFSPYK